MRRCHKSRILICSPGRTRFRLGIRIALYREKAVRMYKGVQPVETRANSYADITI